MHIELVVNENNCLIDQLRITEYILVKICDVLQYLQHQQNTIQSNNKKMKNTKFKNEPLQFSLFFLDNISNCYATTCYLL